MPNQDKRDTLEKDLANVKNKLYETGDAMGQTARHAKDRASDLMDTTRERLEDKQEELIKSIRKNPLKAVLISFLVGAIGSIIIR